MSTVSGASSVASLGGLVGANSGSCVGSTCYGAVGESYALGPVSGDDNAVVGGLVGSNYGGSIGNSYSSGTVTGGDSAILGGLIGVYDENSSSLTDSYAVGGITGGSNAILGGLVGQDLVGSGITNSYWDMDTSGVTDPAQGAGNIENDPGIIGLSDAQLKSGLPAGFDPAIWAEKARIDGGYPYLLDNPPPK